ncbi:MAG: SDR family oxidoreductase [Planctomycetia bacterium]|nr:SDR family oxidoreductase [Planctomycetia bacterium]
MGVLDRFRLDGRTAVVTGGSRGLGRAMAQALAEAGADLILIGRETDTLEEARKELTALGRWVAVIQGDVGTPAGAQLACQQVLNLARPVDILLNNVGGRRVDLPTEEMPIEQWQLLFDLNLTSALVCSQQLCKGMLERGRGAVVNITSVAGPLAIKGIRGRHYETAKAALTGLTHSLAADWASRGVRVNAIAPGGFLTAPNRRWFSEKPDFKADFESRIPMGRLGEPEELGPAAVFLASDAASYITGATLVVDGGYVLW